MRAHLTLVLILIAAATVSAQLQTEFTTVSGKVIDESGQPMVGVKVEIRPAEVDAAGNMNSDFSGGEAINIERASDPSKDREIFGWDDTDKKGRYSIRGVNRPGAYILIIRNLTGYIRVDAPISIGSAVRNFEADLIMAESGLAEVPAAASTEPAQSPEMQLKVAAARRAEEAGDFKTAVKNMEEVVKLAPDSAFARFHLARMVYESGDADRALKVATKSTELGPECADCWLIKAQLEQTAGLKDEALASAAKAAELAPESGEAQGIEGVLLYEKQKYGEALEHLEAAADHGSEDPNVYLYMANCLVASKRFKEAESAYKDFLGKFPDAPNRGQVEQVLAQLESLSQ